MCFVSTVFTQTIIYNCSFPYFSYHNICVILFQLIHIAFVSLPSWFPVHYFAVFLFKTQYSVYMYSPRFINYIRYLFVLLRLKGLLHKILTLFWLEWIYLGLNSNRFWFFILKIVLRYYISILSTDAVHTKPSRRFLEFPRRTDN
jgi:hypothetical protein